MCFKKYFQVSFQMRVFLLPKEMSLNKGETQWCEILTKRDLKNCAIFPSPPLLSLFLIPLPSSPPHSCLSKERAAIKNPLQAKFLPLTVPWIGATGGVFMPYCLGARSSHQIKAPGAHEASALLVGEDSKVNRLRVVTWLRAKAVASNRLGF